MATRRNCNLSMTDPCSLASIRCGEVFGSKFVQCGDWDGSVEVGVQFCFGNQTQKLYLRWTESVQRQSGRS